MDRKNWYFKQPVTDNDMDFALSTGVEKFFRQQISDAGGLFGVVRSDLGPGSGLTVTFVSVLAYDKAGRRITPYSGTLITQSIVSATDGTPTAVGSSGNERWVSLFAKGGRKYTDAATDGSGNNVRATAVECLNALGDSTHPLGAAYDATAAKEAGVDLLYIVAGTEDALGRAVRPTLVDDGVLLADVHLVFGQTALVTRDIHVDRRQDYLGSRLRMDGLSRDLYRAADNSDLPGPTSYTQIQGDSGLDLAVYSGRGYVHQHTTTSTFDTDPPYVRYVFPPSGSGGSGIQRVPAVAPHASLPRQDLLVVNTLNELRLLPGTPAAIPVPPAVPSNNLALAEVRAMPGTTDTSTWPWVRSSFRLLPFPFSTSNGILDGCSLRWTHNGSSFDCYLESPRNRIVFEGQVVEFAGGLDTFGAPYLLTTQDQAANPLSGSSVDIGVYYIYACRNSFYFDAVRGFTSPVILVESLQTPNDVTGNASVSLQGPRGTIPTTDTMLIGVGWSIPSSGIRSPVQVCGDWFTPLRPMVPNNLTPGVLNATVSMGGAPVTRLCGTARVTVTATTSRTVDSQLFIGHYDAGPFTVHTINCPAAVDVVSPTFGQLVSLGQFDVPLSFGNVTVSSTTGATFKLQTSSFQVVLPRVTAGLG